MKKFRIGQRVVVNNPTIRSVHGREGIVEGLEPDDDRLWVLFPRYTTPIGPMSAIRFLAKDVEPLYTYWTCDPKHREVFAGEEVDVDAMVIPMIWVAPDGPRVSIPGTEVYGYVPED